MEYVCRCGRKPKKFKTNLRLTHRREKIQPGFNLAASNPLHTMRFSYWIPAAEQFERNWSGLSEETTTKIATFRWIRMRCDIACGQIDNGHPLNPIIGGSNEIQILCDLFMAMIVRNWIHLHILNHPCIACIKFLHYSSKWPFSLGVCVVCARRGLS